MTLENHRGPAADIAIARAVQSVAASPVLSWTLGFMLVLSSPVGGGAFQNWLIPLPGDYRMTFFDAVALLASLVTIASNGFRVLRTERFLYTALFAVLVSRAISILVAEAAVLQQWLSVMRYVEMLVLVYISNLLFANPQNRASFFRGLLLGVVAETVGGIALFATSAGESRGILISVNSFMLQTYIIVFFVMRAARNKRTVGAVFGMVFVSLGLLMTLTRSAVILLALSLVLWFVLARRGTMRVLVVFAFVGAMGAVAVGRSVVLSNLESAITFRSQSAFEGSSGGIFYRFYLWDMALAEYLRYPVTGIGSGGFARQQGEHGHVFAVDLPMEYLSLDASLGVHHTVLGVAAETGTVGLAAFFLYALAVFRTSKRALQDGAVEGADVVAAAAILNIALLFTDLWGQGSFTVISSVFLGFVAGWQREREMTSRRLLLSS